MNTDPAGAPPRTDLLFLRHRGSRPRVAAARPSPPASTSPPAATGQPQPAAGAASSVSDFLHGQGRRPAHHGAAATQSAPNPAPNPAPASTPTPAPAAGSSLDLSAPAAPAPAAPATTPAGVRPAPAAGSSLDLSTPPSPAPSGRQVQPAAPAPPARERPRLVAGRQRILDIKQPTVVLTRVQSGVGQLEIEAACSADVGDLRLGAAYQLASGPTSTVQLAGGNRFAPSSRRPVVVAGRDEYENLRIDLRQNRELRRLAVYAFSESRATLTWGGTLLVSTFGGGRIELPLESLYAGQTAVLLSIYNHDGEFVVRAEMETIDGDVREAARAYGYDRITWRDARSPVD